MSLSVVIVGFLLLSCAGSKKSPTPTPTATGKKGATSDSGVAELQLKLETLESQEQDSRTLIVQLRDQLAELETNPGQASAESIEELREKLSALEGLTDHSAKIASLQEELNTLKEGDGDYNAERIAELEAIIDEIQDKYDALLESTENLSQNSADNVAQQSSESSTESPTELPTLKAYLTYAGSDFFRDGLIQVITFSDMAGVTDIKQKTDLDSGSVNQMPTTTISFQFNGKKYCAPVALTSEQFVPYKDAYDKQKTRKKEATKIDVGVSECN